MRAGIFKVGIHVTKKLKFSDFNSLRQIDLQHKYKKKNPLQFFNSNK
jgi:hypothetical protein